MLSRPAGAIWQESAGGRPSDIPRLPAEPWSGRDLVRAVQYLLLTAVLLGTAWYGASDTTDFVHQVYWVVLGIGATALLSFGALMFVLDGMREIRRRRLALMQDLDSALSPAQPLTPVGHVEHEHAVAASLMTHYHRRSCPLVRGKAIPHVGPPATHVDAGRVPCGVCAP